MQYKREEIIREFKKYYGEEESFKEGQLEAIEAVLTEKRALVVQKTGWGSLARAMNRNKYIYASSYGTFVVESEYNKGGTWSGAAEAVKNKWGKVFVNDLEGNKKLIELGGFLIRLQKRNSMIL